MLVCKGRSHLLRQSWGRWVYLLPSYGVDRLQWRSKDLRKGKIYSPSPTWGIKLLSIELRNEWIYYFITLLWCWFLFEWVWCQRIVQWGVDDSILLLGGTLNLARRPLHGRLRTKRLQREGKNKQNRFYPTLWQSFSGWCRSTERSDRKWGSLLYEKGRGDGAPLSDYYSRKTIACRRRSRVHIGFKFVVCANEATGQEVKPQSAVYVWTFNIPRLAHRAVLGGVVNPI